MSKRFRSCVLAVCAVVLVGAYLFLVVPVRTSLYAAPLAQATETPTPFPTATPQAVLSPGYYEEYNEHFDFDNGSEVSDASYSGGAAMAYDGVSFWARGSGVVLYVEQGSSGGDLEVCLGDLECETVSDYAESTGYRFPLRFAGPGLGSYTVTVDGQTGSHVLDAVEVLPELPLRSSGAYGMEPVLTVYYLVVLGAFAFAYLLTRLFGAVHQMWFLFMLPFLAVALVVKSEFGAGLAFVLWLFMGLLYLLFGFFFKVFKVA